MAQYNVRIVAGRSDNYSAHGVRQNPRKPSGVSAERDGNLWASALWEPLLLATEGEKTRRSSH